MYPQVFLKLNSSLQRSNCDGKSFTYRDLDFEIIQTITRKCINLKEVDFSGSIGSFGSIAGPRAIIRYLVNNITTNLEKISLASVEQLGDDHVHILAQRFYELDTEHSCVLCSR